MELIEWVLAFKNLAVSSAVKLSQNESNFVYVSAYVLALFISDTRQLRLSFLLLVACIVISNSVIYDYLNGYQLHLGYSVVYLYSVKYMKGLKTIIALCLLAWFNVIMSWDAYHYATTETWLYLNYERITACLHAAIIISCVNWRRIINSTRNIFSGLRVLWLNNGYFLYN